MTTHQAVIEEIAATLTYWDDAADADHVRDALSGLSLRRLGDLADVSTALESWDAYAGHRDLCDIIRDTVGDARRFARLQPDMFEVA